MKEGKLNPVLLVAGIGIALALLAFVVTRNGAARNPAAGDVSGLIPKVTEQTPPPPPGLPEPASFGGLRKGATAAR